MPSTHNPSSSPPSSEATHDNTQQPPEKGDNQSGLQKSLESARRGILSFEDSEAGDLAQYQRGMELLKELNKMMEEKAGKDTAGKDTAGTASNKPASTVSAPENSGNLPQS